MNQELAKEKAKELIRKVGEVPTNATIEWQKNNSYYVL
jgi:hypothetical protein